MKRKIPYLLHVLLLHLAFFGYSQTTVQFQVNMNYQITLGNFNPNTQTVDIAGSFNNWGTPPSVLTDADGDGIYITSFQLTVGTTYAYKTRINGLWNGTEEFANGGANRSYTAVANDVVAYWYNDAIPANALDVQIASSVLVAQPGQDIQFTDNSLGSPVSWQWSFTGANVETSTAQNPVVSYAAAGLYPVTLAITNAAGQVATKTFTNFIRIDAMETHWWNDRVFYEVFVRSFKDSNGDGKGDIQGLISKLDYLNDGNPNTTTDLGITGLWLMPIQQSPSYHGYDVTDYMAVEQDYGNSADFTALINACHERGIKVIIDMVMNHTSTQHPWFVASASSPTNEKRDWYIWESTDPGTPGPLENYPWAQKNGAWYYNAFYSGMPDLNFNNPAVHTAFEEIADFWLTDMNVDGFRLDAVRYLYESGSINKDAPQTIAYWQEFRDYYKSVKPEAFAVGEAWDVTSIASQYVNNNGLDYCFEFQLADSIIESLNNGTAAGVNSQMQNVVQSYPHLQWGTFLSNHDTNRVMSQLLNSADKAKAAATLLLTLPGVPYIYYGEEIGMTGITPDENKRTPMQWSNTAGAGFTTGNPWYSINADYTTKNVATQQTTTGSMWQLYRDLIAIRNTETALKQGTYLPVTANNAGIFAYIRQYQNENVLVVVNVGGSSATDVSLTLANGNITPGNYTMAGLLGTANLDVTIGTDGGFNGLNAGTIAAKGYKMYKLTGALNTPAVQQAALKLYPNPANNSFRMSLDAQSTVIYNLAGQKVKSTGATRANESIDITGLANGMYLVKVTDAKGRTSTIKLLKG